MSKLITCEKCGGSGHLPGFMHVEAGLCFRCDGTGKALPMVKRDLNQQCCDRIFNLYKEEDGIAYHVGVWVWDAGTGKTKAGTGHWSCSMLNTRTGESMEITTSGGPDHCIELAQLREDYKGFLFNGFTLMVGADELAFIEQHMAPYCEHWEMSAQDMRRYLNEAA